MADYVNVGKVSEFRPGVVRTATIDRERVAVFNENGKFYAFSNYCTHAGYELSSGFAAGGFVYCPLHGACFDLSTGEPVDGPAMDPLTIFDVRIEGDEVLVSAKALA